jgi:hypothetical protein
MKHAVEIGSGAMIYILSFIKTGSSIENLIGVRNEQKHRHVSDCISLLLFFLYALCKAMKS